MALDQLRDPARIRRPLVFPFRYLAAMANLPDDPRLRAAISDAVDIALDNTPVLPGRMLVCVDNSGSMKWQMGGPNRRGYRRRRRDGEETTAEKPMLQTVTHSHTAAMFAALFKASQQDGESSVGVISFGTGAHYVTGLAPMDSLLRLTEQLAREEGGTSYEANL